MIDYDNEKIYTIEDIKEIVTKKSVDLFIEKNIDKNSKLYKNMINMGVVIYE